MGRKPNALILEFFQRGAKLEDASNRYQHTCKACGEKFPKGRIDSLTTHLVKKCPAISLRDRQKALLELNNLPADLADSARHRNGEIQMNGPTVELPLGNRNWTALETLAEVSRQIDLSEKHDDRSVNNKSGGPQTRGSEPPRSDRLELQEQYTLDNPPVSYEQRVQRDKKILSQKTARRDSEATLPPANFASNMRDSRSTSPNLVSTAVAAARFVPNMVDPQLLGEDIKAESSTDVKVMEQIAQANAAMPDNFFNSEPVEQQPAWPMLDGSVGNMYPDPDHLEHDGLEIPPSQGTFSRLTMNTTMTTEFSAEYGNGQKPTKPRVRGRFTPTRRREVQEVRKLGACIRCRMLKKPCSGGTPCNTCKSVESARLWRTPCIRTRIADELDMYSAGLHAVLAYHEVNRTKSQVTFRASLHQIEASHYPESTVFAAFKALEGQNMPSMDGNIDPGLGPDFGPHMLRILDNDNDDLPMKLEAYMKRILPVFLENEPSHFMHVTLNTAMELSVQKEDVLLTRVLELWSIVHILVDHELHWTVSERVDPSSEPGKGPVIDQSTNDVTYGLLCLQLNAAAEKKAAQICKNVLNDLERRLLQRSSTSSFETFLVAIILLNCVEKSTWLFKSWEQDSFKARWPLDKTPVWYASQGDRITDLLQMLLRMRSVPPKTYTRPEDGILATEADPVSREYFEKLRLNSSELLEKQANHVFDPANSRCYELRFCSKLLLPAA
ncbi:hypothetical protein F5884DRAFT_435760 [Xylogone sp. PMI_703]|nr:hypothetical protein F5884DRAFT_435760 [Xylogone sp. PMI_703]